MNLSNIDSHLVVWLDLTEIMNYFDFGVPSFDASMHCEVALSKF